MFSFASFNVNLLVVILFYFSATMSRKEKKMKVIGSLEEFTAKFNIPLSVGLRFVEDDEVDLAVGSPVLGELFLAKSYFEAKVSENVNFNNRIHLEG